MRIAINIVAVLMLLIGAVWFLQGLNLLKGSVMSGEGRWIFVGGIVFVAGALAAALNNRRRGS